MLRCSPRILQARRSEQDGQTRMAGRSFLRARGLRVFFELSQALGVRVGRHAQLLITAVEGRGAVVDPSTDLGLAPPGLMLADGPYPGLLRVAFHAHLMRYVLGGSGWLATPAPSVQLDISARPTTSQIKSQGVFSITTTRVQSRSRARATMEASPVRRVKLSTLTLAEKIGVPLSI